MRIVDVQIHNFNSFNGSQAVGLDERITIILGKNESGKTNFLKALASFDSSYKYSSEELCTYSQSRNEFEDEHVTADNLPMIQITFVLEPKDAPLFKEIHESLGAVREFTVTKYFSGRRLLGGEDYQKARHALDTVISLKTESIKHEVSSLISLLKQDGVLDEKFKPVEAFISSFDPLKSNPDQLTSTVSTVQTALQGGPTLEGELLQKRTAVETAFREFGGR